VSHLAQINVGRLVAPIDDPLIAEFVAQLDTINHLAESSPKFIWRMQSEQGNATVIPYNDDPFMISNMSVWETIEALQSFTYKSQHMRVFRDRRKWFQKMDLPHYCLWWVPEGHIPTLSAGKLRLEHYQRRGSTPEAFWFNEPYPAPVGDLVPA
jgi:hypothetical protein